MSAPPSPPLLERLQAALHRLHTNPFFEWTTICIILISSFNVGLKSYNLSDLAQSIIVALDNIVTLYFLVEIIIRIIAAGGIRAFFRAGGWNIFDFIIVTGSLIPVNESEYALLARLLRLFRVMRLIYFVPQLRVLVGALVKAIPRIIYVALMMFVIFYIYGAVGNLLFAQINPELWGNVGVSMLTLFRVATLEDWTDVMYETMTLYPMSWIYYLTFIFFSAFVFLNMMIGVIIDSLNEEHGSGGGQKTANDTQNNAQVEACLLRIEKRLEAVEEHLRTQQNTAPPKD